MASSWNSFEDRQRASSGIERRVDREVGTWHLNVKFPVNSYVTMFGALRFRGDAEGNLWLSIEMPEDRLSGHV